MRYRDGLMIALLAHHPLRLANLATLRLGCELHGNGTDWWLEIEPTATKNRRAYLAPLACNLIQPLDHYLRHWRAGIAGATAAAASDALWLSGEGRALGAKQAHYRICRRTAAAFGLPVNPHLFRDALATTIAVRRPELIGMVTPLLGHGSIATAQRHYNRAGMISTTAPG
jgi:integrase